MLLAGVLLIVLQTAVRAVIVLPSYYWQDDYIHMEAAGRQGLSREFLIKDHNGHLEIGSNFVFWLIGHDAGLSFLPAALFLLGLQLAASCLLLAVLRQLFGRSPWLLLPFACYLFTPLALPVATWLAAGLQALPMQIAMLTALLGLVRALRTRSWRWAAVSAGGTAAGLIFWEKAVLVVPALVAVVVLVEWAGEPWARRMRLLAAGWPFFLPHVLLVAAYVPLFASVVDSTTVLDLDAETVLPRTGETVLRMLIPGLFGGPWTSEGGQNTRFADVGVGPAALAATLAVLVILASVWLRGRRASQGWLLVAGYVAVDIAILQFGRSDFLYIVARDPRYISDALPIIVIGCCAAFSGPLVDRRVPRRVVGAAGMRVAGLAAGALLIASCLISSSQIAREMQHVASKEYVEDALRAMDENPDVSVINGHPPGSVVLVMQDSLEGLLRAVGQERSFDRPSTNTRMFDGQAVLRPFGLVETSLAVSGDVADCGWLLEATAQRLGDVRRPFVGPRVLQLNYLTGQEATLYVAVGGDEQELTIPAGVGQAFFVITNQRGPVEARVAEGAGGLCVDNLVVGAPLPIEPD